MVPCFARLPSPITVLFRVATLLCLATGVAEGQTLLREDGNLSAIRFEKVVTLGDPAGPGFVGMPIDVERRINGEWVVTTNDDPAAVKFFLPSGQWIRTIGGGGDGPGEFTHAWYLWVLPGDGLAVSDPFKGRVTLYDSDLKVFETRPMRIPTSSMVFLPDGRIVAAARLNTPGQIGLPVHLLDSLGAVEASFGADPVVTEWGNQDKVARILSPAGDEAVWSGEITAYRLERWTLSGHRTANFSREVPWYRPHDNYGFQADPSQPPGPGIVAIHQDREGLVWLAIRVPDRHWERAFQPGVDSFGRERPMVTDWNLYYDTMVEVVDVAKGTVVASARFPVAAGGFTQGGLLFSHYFRDDGEPFVEVWEPIVERRLGGLSFG